MVARSDSTKAGNASKTLDLKTWISVIGENRDQASRKHIRKAVEIADKAHAGQLRDSGDPYLSHCLAVAEIVHHLHLDTESIIAAILHDAVEDTDVTLDDIETSFNRSIRNLVDGVTKMGHIDDIRHPEAEGEKASATQSENLRKLLLAMAEDIRVVLIKLSDRLHNMRTLKHLSPERQQRIARETQEIYAPLANRLGIWTVKWELEDLSLRHLEPVTYRKIAGLLDGRRVDREKHIEEVKLQLTAMCEKEGIEAQISGRPKHIYSIWKKMQRKNIDFDQIFDIQAVRVLVNKASECYAVLGMVHGLWQHIPKEFDDYIAHPKPNNYRSLHTAVVGPGGRPIEVQIRTFEMHEHAELGVAAHWRYKEGGQPDSGLEKKINWLRQLLEWKDEEATADDFVDRFKSESVDERIYVFTPAGQVVDLPAGATGLDFAYHIHTDVGHRCRGVKIDGRMVPLTTALLSGQQIEVVTAKQPSPSRDWLNQNLGYLTTTRARSKVRHWFREMDRDINVDAGRASFEAELKRLGIRNVSLESVLPQLNYTDSDTLMAALGHGDLHVSTVINALSDSSAHKSDNAFDLPVKKRPKAEKSVDGFTVEGVGNLMSQAAKCCRPVPNDPIVGYITKGRGVSIHRADCSNVLRIKGVDQDRLIEVGWGASPDQLFPVDIEVLSYDRQGLLRDISTELTNQKINVLAVTTQSVKKNMTAKMSLKLEVSDINQLSRVLTKIGQLPNVVEVKRKF